MTINLKIELQSGINVLCKAIMLKYVVWDLWKNKKLEVLRAFISTQVYTFFALREKYKQCRTENSIEPFFLTLFSYYLYLV